MKNVVTPEREERIRGAVHHTDDASVPTGVQYLMLYGALGPTVFLDPSPEQMAEKMTAEERAMLDMRKNARSCVFMEHNRIDGPEVKTRAPGIAPGPGIQIGTFNINAVENEDELGCWYSQVRMPRLTSMEGASGRGIWSRSPAGPSTGFSMSGYLLNPWRKILLPRRYPARDRR